MTDIKTAVQQVQNQLNRFKELPDHYIQEALDLGYDAFHRWWYSFLDKGRYDLWIDILARTQVPGDFDHTYYHQTKRDNQEPDTRSYTRYNPDSKQSVPLSRVSEAEQRLAVLCEPQELPQKAHKKPQQHTTPKRRQWYWFLDTRSLCILWLPIERPDHEPSVQSAKDHMHKLLPRGINYVQGRDKYRVRVGGRNGRTSLGMFDCPYEAMTAYVKHQLHSGYQPQMSVEDFIKEQKTDRSHVTAPDDVVSPSTDSVEKTAPAYDTGAGSETTQQYEQGAKKQDSKRSVSVEDLFDA